MSVEDLPPGQLIALALEAIGERAGERLRPLISDDIVIAIGESEHRGTAAALSWSQRAYEHLDRHYRVARLEPLGSGLLGSGRVEYVWRDSGEVGDSTPVFFGFRIENGRLGLISVQDDREDARRALGVDP